ncbi:hypothetical protein SB00610_02518 [Klebsiella quasipneumoniae subsp. similipneumoniae]|nr:hypothetical protein SB00610_02518 [Klebsiella quasipneumoniae subsp. similipneumoniae]
MHLRLHAHAGQPNRVFNPFLVVNGVFLRNHVQDAMLIADANRLRGMDHVFDVVQRHFFFRNRYHPDFILTAYMFTRKSQIN